MTATQYGKDISSSVLLTMKPEVKDQLVKVLRLTDEDGGHYLQTRRELCNSGLGVDCFCVNGVLTNLAVLSGEVDYDVAWQSRTLLSPDVRRWAGLTMTAEAMLARLNDSGYTFPALADWIEEHL